MNCHRDTLHCIYARLSLDDALPAMRTCREWNAAANCEPSRKLECATPQVLLASAQSKLGRGRHVARIRTDGYSDLAGACAWGAYQQAYTDTGPCTSVVHRWLTHPMSLPRTLTHLEVRMFAGNIMHSMCVAIAECRSLHSLVLAFWFEPRTGDWRVLRKCVAQMPQLRFLSVQTSCIRQLGRLCAALPPACHTVEYVTPADTYIPSNQLGRLIARLPAQVTRVNLRETHEPTGDTRHTSESDDESDADADESNVERGSSVHTVCVRMPHPEDILRYLPTTLQTLSLNTHDGWSGRRGDELGDDLVRFTQLARLTLNAMKLIDERGWTLPPNVHLCCIGCTFDADHTRVVQALAATCASVRLVDCVFHTAFDVTTRADIDAWLSTYRNVQCTGASLVVEDYKKAHTFRYHVA
jgi:hypothetical protein